MRNGALRLGAAIASTLIVAVVMMTTAVTGANAATDPDPVMSPPGANDWQCKPSAAHPHPVVLVHGTFANRYENWLVLSPLLKSKGYCVFALDYGHIAGTPQGPGLLFPINGLAKVTESAGELAGFVDQVLAATGASKVDIVGHSQGGMMPNYYLKFLGGAAKTNALVGLAPDNHGTTLDGLTNLLPFFPAVGDLIFAACPSCQDQVVGSDFIKKLNSVGDTVPGVTYTVIATRLDEVVTPYTSGFLQGANVTNVTVQDRCPFDLAEHVLIAFDPTALHYVTNALDPAHATRVYCG